MKSILSAVLFVSFLLSGPAMSYAGDAETKKEEKKDAKKPAAGGPAKKDPPKDDGFKTRGR